MIIVNLSGGLGNQMFQYAFGRKIAIKINTNLKYHYTNSLFATRRKFSLNIFNIEATQATNEDLKSLGVYTNEIFNRINYYIHERLPFNLNSNIITEKIPFRFDNKYLEIGDNKYLQGYWANTKYFENISDKLRCEFTLKEKVDYINQKSLDLIQNCNSVSIHVRRTDYMKHFVGEEYYYNAIQEILSKVNMPVFFIFSDDIKWCKSYFSQFSNVCYIEHNTGKNSFLDLYLMSKCKHNIVGNSTFSFWASWLNTTKNKVTIFPRNNKFNIFYS